MANEVKIIITADPSGAITGIKNVTGSMRTMEKDTGGIISNLKSHWLGYSAAIAGAMVIANKAWNMAEMAAQFEEQRISLNALAGQYNTTADVIIKSVKSASQGLVSMTDAVSISAKALMMGLNPDQLMQFMKIAEITSNVTGAKVADNFRMITEAAAAGRERTLKQMGIVVDFTGAYKDYATSIRKTAADLDDMEKLQAAANVIMAKGDEITKRLGMTSNSTADKMDRLKVTIADLQLQMGTFVIRGGVGMIGILQNIAGLTMLTASGFLKISEGLYYLEEKALWADIKLKVRGAKEKQAINKAIVEDSRKSAAETLKIGLELFKKGTDNFTAMVAKSEDLAKAQAKVGTETKTTATNIETATDKIKDLNKQIQDLIDKATLSPLELIAKQAKEWQNAGANELKIKAWVAAETKKINDKFAEDTREKELKILESRTQLIENLADVGKSDYQRKIDAANKWVEEQEKINAFLLKNDKTHVDKTTEIYAAGVKKRAEIVKETLLQAQKEKQAMMMKGYRESWQQINELVGKVEGEPGKGLDIMAGGLQTMMDSLIKFEEEKRLLQEQGAFTEIERDRLVAQQKISIAQGTASMLAGISYSLYAATGSQSKAMLNIYKAAAIVEATISTHKAAVDALAWGLKYGGPAGPKLGFAMAAIVAAAGMARVAQIIAMKPGGNVGVGTGGGGGNIPLPREVISPTPTTPTETQRPVAVNLYVYGSLVDHDAFAREIIPSITKAVNDGVR